MNIQYNTISNWVNLAKGEHNCQFCGRTFPWKAVLEKHIEKHHKVLTKLLISDIEIKIKIKIKLQDGEGDGMNSREGFSVSHYPEHFKEEVVAFAKATSQKEAKDRLPNISYISNFHISCLVCVDDVDGTYST